MVVDLTGLVWFGLGLGWVGIVFFLGGVSQLRMNKQRENH